MIDEEFGVYSEFAIEHIFWQLRYVIKRACAMFGEPRRNAGADVPNVGDGLVVPHGFPKRGLGEFSDEIGALLCEHVERNLS